MEYEKIIVNLKIWRSETFQKINETFAKIIDLAKNKLGIFGNKPTPIHIDISQRLKNAGDVDSFRSVHKIVNGIRPGSDTSHRP